MYDVGKGGFVPKKSRIRMSSLFVVTIQYSLKPHPAYVIARNSNSTLPNDFISRQNLIDKYEIRARTF